MPIFVNLVHEDVISEVVMLKMLESFSGKYHHVSSYGNEGFGYIKKNINGFNQASIASTFFVLIDLDDFECPLSLLNEWLEKPPNHNFICRVAVREIEAWLLADKEGFSEFTGVSLINFPDDPELERDPKRKLISIVKRSRKRQLKEDILPINNNASIGPNYNERLMQFVLDYWEISRACNRSESLRRAFKQLENYQLMLRGNS